MNIHDASKRLIEIGIPGKNKKQAIKSTLVKKDSTHVEKALRKYVEKMLVRWAYTEGIIQKPERHKDKNGTTEIGRGKTSDWPETTVEQAAAVWALGNQHGKRSVTKNTIDAVRDAVIRAYRYPSAFYDPPRIARITGPDPTSQWFVPWQLWKTMVHHDDKLNALATTWIAAREKAKRNVPVSKQKQVVFHWRSRPRREEEKTIYLGRLGGCNVFAIGGPADRERLAASLARRNQNLPSSAVIEDPRDPDGGPIGFPQEYTRMVIMPNAPNGWDLFPVRWTFGIEKIELEDALHDEIVFLLDGRDSRIKAFYAPYETYDPSVDYEKRAGAPDQNVRMQRGP